MKVFSILAFLAAFLQIVKLTFEVGEKIHTHRKTALNFLKKLAIRRRLTTAHTIVITWIRQTYARRNLILLKLEPPTLSNRSNKLLRRSREGLLKKISFCLRLTLNELARILPHFAQGRRFFLNPV